MTMPLLPDTDLARLAPLSDELKRSALRQMKGGFSTFSYKPVRSCFGDVFNLQIGMFAPVAPTPWEKISERLIRACKAGDELKNNLQIAKALHDYAVSSNIAGRQHEFFPMAMGIGRKVSLWLPMVLAIDAKPYAIFIDPRRNKGLTTLGRRFAFSMMHERIRAADEDFADFNLGIMRFLDNDDGSRSVRLYSDSDVELYSLDELEAMVASTYRIWQEVIEEREAETRRKRTGTGDLL
ncbi:type VI toxin-antitoxin system SocB family DNA replication inhibitor toxin [Sinorhizobium fredii]|uniref:type VI toxin-antitoxin system SocB family DNA replication inhibitor toxin n=1 Tax=Rhizobium fredii TaxID=380 RepID=UPI0033954D02